MSVSTYHRAIGERYRVAVLDLLRRTDRMLSPAEIVTAMRLSPMEQPGVVAALRILLNESLVIQRTLDAAGCTIPVFRASEEAAA